MTVSLDSDFVASWSQSYIDKSSSGAWALERELFDEVGPCVLDRCFYKSEELRQVVRWKAARSTGFLKDNSGKDVECITRAALGTDVPVHLRIRRKLTLQP